MTLALSLCLSGLWITHPYHAVGGYELYSLFDCWTLVSALLGTRPRGSPPGHSPHMVARLMRSEVQLGTHRPQPALTPSCHCFLCSGCGRNRHGCQCCHQTPHCHHCHTEPNHPPVLGGAGREPQPSAASCLFPRHPPRSPSAQRPSVPSPTSPTSHPPWPVSPGCQGSHRSIYVPRAPHRAP